MARRRDRRRGFAEALARGTFGGWDEVLLPMMSGDTPLPNLLVNAMRAVDYGPNLRRRPAPRYVELPATWDDYLKSLGPNSRRNVQRSLRAFEAWSGGTMRLESVTHPADLDKAKQVLINLHHALGQRRPIRCVSLAVLSSVSRRHHVPSGRARGARTLIG